jgi:uncharacterized protein (DUF924 family)
MTDLVTVLDFWLGEVGPDGWYAGGAVLDAQCRDGFRDLWTSALNGGLSHWVDGTVGSLAFIVLTDQLPRNMHRGHADAFATDPLARDAARQAIAAGWDLGAPEPDRQFFYLPFEHSEDPDDQALAVRLMEERVASDPDLALHARAHQEIIRRFGRFPFRNAALGRINTPEEVVFLENGSYPAFVRAMKG